MSQITFGLEYAYSPDVQYYSFVFWSSLPLSFQMSFSKFPFQRNSCILWLPNSGPCTEKLFYAFFFTWSKAMWSPHIGKKNNSSHFKWMSSIIGKEEKDSDSQHYHHYCLCTWLVSLSLLPSVHYYALRMRILQFNKDMEYLKVHESIWGKCKLWSWLLGHKLYMSFPNSSN